MYFLRISFTLSTTAYAHIKMCVRKCNNYLSLYNGAATKRSEEQCRRHIVLKMMLSIYLLMSELALFPRNLYTPTASACSTGVILQLTRTSLPAKSIFQNKVIVHKKNTKRIILKGQFYAFYSMHFRPGQGLYHMP